VVLAPSAWLLSRPPDAVGVVPPSRHRVHGALALAPRSSHGPTIRTHPAGLADLRLRAGPRPIRVRIGAIGVVAPVVPVGADPATGAAQVPASVRTVGWYQFGPRPGEPGSAVLVGHVDSATQGIGSLFRLRELRPGAVIKVRFADGALRSFSMVGMRTYPQGALPARIFARSGRPVLVLITCGGPFDRATRSYADNVVVYAVPRWR
jgi:hypothetical protein